MTNNLGGASREAIDAAHCEYHDRRDRGCSPTVGAMVSDVLAAAHDPALGDKRSVCLADVIAFVDAIGYDDVASFIRGKFGGHDGE